MFKKINQYLITHYPLIWNLKLVWILLVGIIFNIIAFTNGFLHYSSPKLTTGYNFKTVFFSELYILYYFIITLIILIIWLFYYIKNNRFKSKYPTSRNYLFKEFLGVFTVLIVFVSVPNVFNYGLHTRIANFITDDEFAEDVDLINRAMPFTLQQQNGYSNHSRNLTVPIFDTLVSQQEVIELYTQHKKEYQIKNNSQYKDLLEPYFRNEEFNELLYRKISDQYRFKPLRFQSSYYDYETSVDNRYYETAYYDYSEVEMDSVLLDATEDRKTQKIYSLYNYSNRLFKVPNQPEKTHQYYDEQLIKLLQSNDKQSIEALLTNVQNKLDTHQIGYRFKNKSWINYVYQPPYYFISNNLSASQYSDGIKKIDKDYVNIDTLIEIYSNIEYSKYTYSFFEEFINYITGALVLALIFMMFRLSSFKVWLISAIGLGILSIIGGGLGVTFGIIGYEEYTEYIIPLLFYCGFIALSIYGLSNNTNKMITGVTLNWWLISSVIVGFIILGLYRDIKEEMVYQAELLKNPEITRYDIYNHPDLELIDQIFNWYLYINPIVVVLIFYFMLSAYRKWQAMAEE